MGPFFGLAGPAEAGLAMEVGVLCIGVVVAFAAAFLTLVIRSRIAAGVGAALWGLLAVWMQPWRDFTHTPSNDRDMQSFQATFRSLAWWWVAGSISLAVAVARVAFWPRRAASAPQKHAEQAVVADGEA